MIIILRAYARKVYGKELEQLTHKEFHDLVSMVMPGREKLVEKIYWSSEEKEALAEPIEPGSLKNRVPYPAIEQRNSKAILFI